MFQACLTIYQTFLTTFHPCNIFRFFYHNLLYTAKTIRKKVSLDAYSCCYTKLYTSKSLRTELKKGEKSMCDILSTPTLECHVLFEWPFTSSRSRPDVCGRDSNSSSSCHFSKSVLSQWNFSRPEHSRGQNFPDSFFSRTNSTNL